MDFNAELPKPYAQLAQNTKEYETYALIAPTGLREYDARFLFGEQINLNGMVYMGMGLGTMLRRHYTGDQPRVVVAHDYRSYSQPIKRAVINGLMATGCHVIDIGLATSPMAYWAQLKMDTEGVAMVTASHNDNGWTGIKMGVEPKLTLGPEGMKELKDIVFEADFELAGGGALSMPSNVAEEFCAAAVGEYKLATPLRVVVACGNGTPGAFYPDALRRLGCEVIEHHCALDYTFPHFNPDPEKEGFMSSLVQRVKEEGAELGLAYDGDGDRIGVVDSIGRRIYNDKIALLLARYLAKLYPGNRFVVDVKSTGLFMVDTLLAEQGCEVDYWKTGHSHIKRRVHEIDALAGFEKSGHFFFNNPVGNLYDDALQASILLLQMIEYEDKKLAGLVDELPETWQAPTMHPACADEKKYEIVGEVSKVYEKLAADGTKVCGQKIHDLVMVNGVRIVLEDGTWGLVRASSNIPSLVVTAESPTNGDNMRLMMEDIATKLQSFPEVGGYDQEIK